MNLPKTIHRSAFAVAVALLANAAHAGEASDGPAGKTCAGVDVEARTAEAIGLLERTWLEAEMRGNTAFLDCLLAPEYSVISVKKDKLISKGELLQRVASARSPGDRPIPQLQSKVAINGDFASAYSWIIDDQGDLLASYVDLYRFAGGRWEAVAGVDL